jgi:hypothetical protein
MPFCLNPLSKESYMTKAKVKEMDKNTPVTMKYSQGEERIIMSK